MLVCIITALFTWMALRTCLAGCDFECLKRLWLPSLYTNWFSDEIIKSSIQQSNFALRTLKLSFLSSIILGDGDLPKLCHPVCCSGHQVL